MKKIIFALILSTFFSCSEDETNIAYDVPTSYFEILINDESYRSPDVEIITNENCGYLLANATNRFDAHTSFRLEFEFTVIGEIKKILLFEYSSVNNVFKTVDFQPAETFQLSNFMYDKSQHTLSFDYEGYLYEHDNPEKKKYIKGRFLDENTFYRECSYFPPHLSVTGESVNFNSVNWTTIKYPDHYEYQFFTENGYMLMVTSLSDLSEYEEGSYTFNTSSDLRISLHKYIGPLTASSSFLRNYEWLHYDCEGTINLAGYSDNPFPHIWGNFIMTAQGLDTEPLISLQGNFEL